MGRAVHEVCGVKAPCGHDGEPIIGAFVNCRTKGCDGLPVEPAFDVEDPTRELCGCGGYMEPYDFGAGYASPWHRAQFPDSVKCSSCARIVWRP